MMLATGNVNRLTHRPNLDSTSFDEVFEPSVPIAIESFRRCLALPTETPSYQKCKNSIQDTMISLLEFDF
ncbi:hypothetical protein YC2023_031773 [Brassica napus]